MGPPPPRNYPRDHGSNPDDPYWGMGLSHLLDRRSDGEGLMTREVPFELDRRMEGGPERDAGDLGVETRRIPLTGR